MVQERDKVTRTLIGNHVAYVMARISMTSGDLKGHFAFFHFL